MVLDELRTACATVAEQAAQVAINRARIPAYAASLALQEGSEALDDDPHLLEGGRETLAAFWITLDAINFGSGWFPTLRKRDGRSGYYTIATGLRETFGHRGPWSAKELEQMRAEEIARALRQDPGHELMELFAWSLRDLGHHLEREHGGSFCALIDAAGGSAPALVEHLAQWKCFADASSYGPLRVPFLKRAQITAADLARAGVAALAELERLTMFADNLVPHVLRLDGVLELDPSLAARIDRGDLLAHGSAEEVEIRACALHAVELIVAERSGAHAHEIDQLLWLRGQGERYKARPRHRCRCTAY